MAGEQDFYRVISEHQVQRLNQLGFVIIKHSELEAIKAANGLIPPRPSRGADAADSFDLGGEFVPDDVIGSKYEVQRRTMGEGYAYRFRERDMVAAHRLGPGEGWTYASEPPDSKQRQPVTGQAGADAAPASAAPAAGTNAPVPQNDADSAKGRQPAA